MKITVLWDMTPYRLVQSFSTCWELTVGWVAYGISKILINSVTQKLSSLMESLSLFIVECFSLTYLENARIRLLKITATILQNLSS
jgi:hypothetical protein